MGDEIIGNRWDSSTGFLIAMIGAIIGLSGIWKFSYLMYENGTLTINVPKQSEEYHERHIEIK